MFRESCQCYALRRAIKRAAARHGPHIPALYTTKAEGSGMGLAIARTVAGARGGRLVAANHEHGGATVHFTLPVGRKGEC